jgi:hypothetical protein
MKPGKGSAHNGSETCLGETCLGTRRFSEGKVRKTVGFLRERFGKP